MWTKGVSLNLKVISPSYQACDLIKLLTYKERLTLCQVAVWT